MCGDFASSVASLFGGMSGGLSEESPAGTPGGGFKLPDFSKVTAGQWTLGAGQGIQGIADLRTGSANAGALNMDAASERAAASRQASLILKDAERVRGAARAATAASGARVDEFSLMNEGEIVQAGEVDAAMALLTGERRARSLEQQAKQQKQGGGMGALTSLFQLGSTIMGGWK